MLLDLRLPQKWACAPALVKAQLGTVCTLATSLSNDTETKALAQSYGAATLLKKITLYTDIVPAIRRCQPILQNVRWHSYHRFPSFSPATFRPHRTGMRPPRMETAQLTLVRQPFDHPDFLFELKHDGFRALAHIWDGNCELISRKRTHTKVSNPFAITSPS